ncbi:hypothetical protein BGX34_003667 [Mortierella sp. NVP85]|nr:hypothetical protein BGX34_003667 [Mortierella sp. NVP85]
MSDNEEGPRELTNAILFGHPTTHQRLKAAVWYIVGEICESQKVELNVVITPQLIASLSELVYTQAESLGRDLEMFAK